MRARRLLAWGIAALSITGAARAQAPPSGEPPPTSSSAAGPASHPIADVEPPHVIVPSEAEYPETARAAGAEGTVELVLTIDVHGAVIDVVVRRSVDPALDAAAVAAAKKLVFSPAQLRGKPVAAKIDYRYAFVRPQTKSEPAPPSPPLASPPPPPAAPSAPAPATAPPEEVHVRGGRRPPEGVAATRVATHEGRLVPGTQGDALQVVESLPGVARPPLASGQIVVWGSAPSDTRVYVDGVPVPGLYHASGLRSLVNADLVEDVQLLPGGYGPAHGRGLGGIVDVTTRTLPRDRVHGYVGADTLDASALVGAPLGPHARAAVAARYGYLDRVLEAVGAPDVGDAFPVPRYQDFQAKGSIDLGGGLLDVVVLESADALDRVAPSSDPALRRTQSTRSSFQRLYARWARASSDSRVTVTPFVGHERSALSLAFGARPARQDVEAIPYGVRAEHRARIGSRLDWVSGLDALGTASSLSREGSLTMPPREGDLTVFGQAPGDDVAADDWSTHVLDVAPYVAFDGRFGPLRVVPGVRLDALLVEGSRTTPRVGQTPSIGFSRLSGLVEPRLEVRLRAAPRLETFAAAGLYHQPPAPEDLSAVFGTPELGPARALHAALGEELDLGAGVSAEMTAFYKSYADLPVRSRLAQPVLARALVQNGEGRSYGVQMMLRRALGPRGPFGWLAYTISRSERRYSGDEPMRPFDYDQPHVLTAVLGQKLGRWVFGARFRYASGVPRTPVLGSFFDARDDLDQPIFGAPSSIRLPPFWQIDVRVERSFRLGRLTELALYLDVLNVTNHDNAEEIVYAPDYSQRAYLKGLPTLAVLGARLEL